MRKGRCSMGYTKSDISLPMSGLDEKATLDDISQASKTYLCLTQSDPCDTLFVVNLYCAKPDDNIPKSNHGVWYVGHAIVKLSRCDEAFFYGNWKEARGCQIEHEVCEKYGILFTEV